MSLSFPTGIQVAFRYIIDDTLDAPSIPGKLIFISIAVLSVYVAFCSVRRTVVEGSQLVSKYRLRHCLRNNALGKEFVVRRLDDQLCGQ